MDILKAQLYLQFFGGYNRYFVTLIDVVTVVFVAEVLLLLLLLFCLLLFCIYC